MASWICLSVCIITAFVLEPATGARLTTSPTQITIGGSNPTSELTVSCTPDANGITELYSIEIGRKPSTGDNQPIIRMSNTGSSVTVVDTSLQQRISTSGSITGATGNIQFILTDLRCTDAASTYYCSTLYLAGSIGSDETPTNITAITYPEQIEMFPTPDRATYDNGQLISFRCTGRMGNQFDVNNLQSLWTWEWRSIDNEFASWTRYPNDQNITYETPTPVSVSGGCQYNGASTLLHTVSNLDNGRQFRCSVINEDYSTNKTVFLVGQAPITSAPGSNTGEAGVDGGMIAGIVVAILVVIVIVVVVIVVIRKKKSGGEHYETKEEDGRDERPEMTPNVVYSTPASYDQRPNRMKGRENNAMDGEQEGSPPNYYNHRGQTNPAMDDDLDDSRASRRSYDDDNTDARRPPQGYGSAV
ncbi:uncharacterized protein LOC124120181 isoform X2 [Haliotis rufescens]|uniref:uncharacterized protein LOC124120181 isoform X2 n=1 Tax=Haliotis rufescens TaxID=6454 RepID=UPI00201F1E8A|nr:uncharacterized protein LOC124120181 isoform X2 [Haliotis rufescens]